MFYLFVVLVLSQVESLVAEPPESDAVLQPPEAVEDLDKGVRTVHL